MCYPLQCAFSLVAIDDRFYVLNPTFRVSSGGAVITRKEWPSVVHSCLSSSFGFRVSAKPGVSSKILGQSVECSGTML